jgi:hypothetical protein
LFDLFIIWILTIASKLYQEERWDFKFYRFSAKWQLAHTIRPLASRGFGILVEQKSGKHLQ